MSILALLQSAGTNDVPGAINIWLLRSRWTLSFVVQEKAERTTPDELADCRASPASHFELCRLILN